MDPVDEIFKRSEKPKFKKKIKHNISYELSNPICGDKVKVYLYIEKNRVKDASFEGEGCMLSMASSDMVIESIIGKDINDILKLDKKFVLSLIKIPLGINRIKCALLPLNAIKRCIISYLKK